MIQGKLGGWFTSFSKRKTLIEDIILLVLLVLCLVGMAITNFSPARSYRYWLSMTAVFWVAGMVIVWSKKPEHKVRAVLLVQTAHWLATAIAVIGVFVLLNTGRLNYETTGLVLLLVLGLAVFLDGYRISWRLSLLGIMLGISSILAALVEQYIWIITFGSLAALVAIVLWERFWSRRTLLREQKLK